MTEDNKPSNQQGSTLRTVSRHIVRQLGMLNSACGDLPLSPVQAHALIEVSQGAISIKKLAQILNIDKSNASRAISHLVEKRFAHTKSNPRDSRSLLAHLTPQGRKLLQKLDHQQNIIFNEILSQLSCSETQQIETAMTLYNKAIQRSRMQQEYTLRVMTPEDNAPMAAVIRTVSAEYGLTSDKGYAVADPTLDSLSEQYQASDACYWVIEKEGEILGGGGIAPLSINTAVMNTLDQPAAKQERVSELQKMYFSQALRGKGFAKRLAYLALDFAREQGFHSCYLETTADLNEAVKLYESIGFKHLDSHLGDTGHDACEMPMLLKL
ncbi:bifunctional helix-turn-helix transcriptional regulator/GNAT family N-acetyltransferase [Shewanella benthica]|uniref:Transcriptional regulator, MarR family protein n=1 Tax=Shewanella benthica KT99 TaxID=314608 RepID=A9D883_9GAMM|nr:bifunctional helix-turn-helix transcriptional regulator/GNAT family N-acetyltransferase [Shewanella benthica]EDQ00944.1 transcriptional regulator, MarR family protein [Shewanella benthica KT99]